MDIKDVTLLLGKQKMVVNVQAKGLVHEINFSWFEKEPGDLPPKRWAEAARGEVVFVQGEEGRVARGGIPRPFVR